VTDPKRPDDICKPDDRFLILMRPDRVSGLAV